jgi:hypothetical protein
VTNEDAQSECWEGNWMLVTNCLGRVDDPGALFTSGVLRIGGRDDEPNTVHDIRNNKIIDINWARKAGTKKYSRLHRDDQLPRSYTSSIDPVRISITCPKW